jgi:hypothetical protein
MCESIPPAGELSNTPGRAEFKKIGKKNIITILIN